MLFNSYAFICLFLPVVLGGYFLLGRGGYWRAAKVWLILASLFFYGWWNPRYVPLLLASIGLNYAFGLAISAARPRPRAGWLLAAGVTANLTCLGYFKYADFFIQNVDALAPGTLPLLHVVLPLGISFFTFTQIAFLVDVYRGIAVEFDLGNYALFVTYFPHLIAGPILHHKQMMPQFADPGRYRVHADNLVYGLTFFCMGLVKKVYIADQLSPYVNTAFALSEGHAVPFMTAWGAALGYALQLYFDFSGYCDMAIGISRMFGVQLPFNFDSPYRATDLIGFWRKWHMTLSSFLRDYVYIPLGGNRHGKPRRYVNLLATMFIGGLWHGANWTFVIWGVLHGLWLGLNHLWNELRPQAVAKPSLAATVIGVALTFLGVTALWVFFRATTFGSAGHMLAGMAGLTGFDLPGWAAPLVRDWHLAGLTFGDKLTVTGEAGATQTVHFPWGPMLIALALAFASPNSQQVVARLEAVDWSNATHARLVHAAWGLLLAVALCASLIETVHQSDFLYFQF